MHLKARNKNQWNYFNSSLCCYYVLKYHILYWITMVMVTFTLPLHCLTYYLVFLPQTIVINRLPTKLFEIWQLHIVQLNSAKYLSFEFYNNAFLKIVFIGLTLVNKTIQILKCATPHHMHIMLLMNNMSILKKN